MRPLSLLSALVVTASALAAAQVPAFVRAIRPPDQAFPSEQSSAGITKFSFIAYGDTRCDCGNGGGPEIQAEHDRVVGAAVAKAVTLASSDHPVKFVVQTGDAVYRGANTERWDVFIPIIERLSKANLWYFLAVGNHDTTTMPVGSTAREPGLRNTLSAIDKLIPAENSPRRLNGYPTYSFGYGNSFFILFDSNIGPDATQLAWVTRQLDGLDRQRYPNVFAVFHHPVFSSGPHGGATRSPDGTPAPDRTEPQTLAMRDVYMPLFRKHHVRMTLTGHDHLLDHWIERYEDGDRKYRLDHVVTGGGGAPTYLYGGDPDTRAYEAAGRAAKVHLEHLMKPGTTPAQNPHHFVLIEVDGDKLNLEVVGTGPTEYRPYRGEPRVELR